MTSQTPENGHPYPEQPEGLLEILQRLDRNLEVLTDLTGRLAEEQTATRIEVQGLYESTEQRYAALDQRIAAVQATTEQQAQVAAQQAESINRLITLLEPQKGQN